MTIFGLHTNTHSPQLAICKEFNWPDHSGQSEIKREENQRNLCGGRHGPTLLNITMSWLVFFVFCSTEHHWRGQPAAFGQLEHCLELFEPTCYLWGGWRHLCTGALLPCLLAMFAPERHFASSQLLFQLQCATATASPQGTTALLFCCRSTYAEEQPTTFPYLRSQISAPDADCKPSTPGQTDFWPPTHTPSIGSPHSAADNS